MDIIEEREITRDGITYRVMITPDYDASPDDADCYSPSDKEAFRRGDWQYVGVIVQPVLDGEAVAAAEDSLWGVEYGFMPAESEPFQGGQHPDQRITFDDILNVHPVPDMISEVRAHLAKLRDQITRGLS